MTFLPIVARELRVAARKRSTFWLRVTAALTGLIIGTCFLIIATIEKSGTVNYGGPLFATLTWMGLAAALAAGLFFTSDALSEEKREGTLGFLFLTDLRGYDVVAGKLLATSLRGIYALLALFPILAVTFFMGGVTGAQFWKSALALLNALFFSLACGLFVSAISRDSQKALAGTLFLLLLFTLGGPILDSIFAGIKKRPFSPLFSLFSPGYVFATAGQWSRSPFWLSLLLTQAFSWVLFGLCSFLIPRTWQEKSSNPLVFPVNRDWAYAWKYGSRKRRAKVRSKLIDRNPVLWLVCRERWQSLGSWAIALMVTLGFGLATALPVEVWMTWSYLGGFVMLLVYLGVTSQACRFFVEARKNGLTELLLVSPLNENLIIRGQWRGLLRMLGLPILLLLIVQGAGAGLSQIAWGRVASQAKTAASTVTVNTNTSTTYLVVTNTAVGFPRPPGKLARLKLADLPRMLAAGAMSALVTAANLIALCWFGMWMGLTSRNANLASLKTIAFVQVIPWLIITFGSAMAIPLLLLPWMMRSVSGSASGVAWVSWYPLLMAALSSALSLGKDIFFFAWSRKRLYSSFRQKAAQLPGQPQFTLPPIAPQNVPVPPVIAAQP